MKKFILLLCFISHLSAKDTFTPISDPDKLPKSALELWQGYDARAENLEVKIIEEWKTDEVTTRYLTYKVGRFKGANSRVVCLLLVSQQTRKTPCIRLVSRWRTTCRKKSKRLFCKTRICQHRYQLARTTRKRGY